MHLFDPSRPEAIAGRPALLVDGSAVPNIVVVPLTPQIVRLQVMLSVYDDHGGYSWQHVDMNSQNVGNFLDNYINDPEGMLQFYFRWIPKLPTAFKPREATSAAASAAVQNLVDLL